MINKKIHYIWLGKGEKSELIKRCIESWKKYLPDYEIKEWNEDNFDIDYNKFTRQSYDAKKYAFTSDVIRLYALYHEGGIYLDTDVEVFKPLDEFLVEPAFTGFEQPYYPVCATMGAEAGNPLIKEMLDYYEDRDFEEITNTEIMSSILEKHGIDRYTNKLQKIDNITIYPQEYFNDTNGYTKHWMKGSWKLKVSLIVPVYNGEEYVETALNSIPKTDNIEVIIVNDGSTDKTKEICEKWKKGKKNVKLINLPENKGLGHAKNVGYDNAKGEYINQLDSDDYLYTEKYEQVLDQLDGTDIVYMNLEQNNGTILDVGTNPEYFCSGCARFIKREFLGDLRCPETRYAEDWHLTQELNKKQHTDKFTGIVAYHYNFPREGSLVDQAQKGLIQDTAPGRQKRIILWQSYFCPIGGVETFAYNWCLQLREYYDITVLCIDGDAKQLARLRKLVKVEKIDQNKKYYADILIRNSVWQRLPENIIAPRIIEMQHANYKYLYETSQFKDQYVKAPGEVEHIGCGEFVAKMYEEVEGIKIPFIRNILAPKKKTEKIYRFITCSRIEDEAKGWKRMAKMCDMMTQAGMKYEWIVFSKQPPDTYIPPQVHFYEPQFDVFDYIGDPAIDYSVLLSDSEGLPLQILESIQYQKPCIVTDIGGCTELIKDGVNGYVVPLDMNFDINRIKDIPKPKPYKGTTAKDWCDYLGDAEYVKKPIKEEPKETGLVKIQAMCEYFDTKVNRDIKTDEVYEVTEARAKEIIKADLAKMYEG